MLEGLWSDSRSGVASLWTGEASLWSGEASLWSGMVTLCSGEASLWSSGATVWPGEALGEATLWPGEASLWTGEASLSCSCTGSLTGVSARAASGESRPWTGLPTNCVSSSTILSLMSKLSSLSSESSESCKPHHAIQGWCLLLCILKRKKKEKKASWLQSEPWNSANHICCLKQSFAHCLHLGSGADCNEQEFLSHDCERSASPRNYNVYLIAAATKQVFSILFTFSSLWLQGSSSNWILMSCQLHRVTSGQSNSGHKQIHISKLFSHIYQLSVKSVYKTSHFTDIKHTYANIRHKFSKS